MFFRGGKSGIFTHGNISIHSSFLNPSGCLESLRACQRLDRLFNRLAKAAQRLNGASNSLVIAYETDLNTQGAGLDLEEAGMSEKTGLCPKVSCSGSKEAG